MRLAVWRLEWRVALARRRLFSWNVAVPALLVVPVAARGAAAAHKAVVLGVTIVLFGTFGSCIPLLRDRATGWTDKVLRSGYGERPWLAEKLAASTALDVVELTPAMTAYLILTGTPGSDVLGLAAPLVAALLVANVLGVLTAGAVRSVAEGALVAAAVGLLGLHFAGLFRPSAPGSWQAAVEHLNPLASLTHLLTAGHGSGSQSSAGSWGPPAATAVLILATWLGGGKLAGSLRRTGRFDTEWDTRYILQPDPSRTGKHAFPNDT
ncbi:MAG: hypothetical protein ACE5HF_05440 [Gemmatimonadota bacterium]